MASAVPSTNARLWFVAALPLVFLVGCGGGSGGGNASCSPPPSIDSSPPTSAAANEQYRYGIQWTVGCFLFDCGINLIQGPSGAFISRGSLIWTPSATDANRSFTFVIATDSDLCGDRATQSWSVAVYPPPAPRPSLIQGFSADRTIINRGETVSLTATFTGTGSIDGVGTLTSGVPVTTAALFTDTVFWLSVSDGSGFYSTAAVNIHIAGPPAIQSFAADPSTITVGGKTTLSWMIGGDAVTIELDPGSVDVTGSAQLVVNPSVTTTYTLTVSGTSTSTAASTQVTVVPAPPAVKIDSFTATPASSVPLGKVSLSTRFTGVYARIDEELSGTYNALSTVKSGDIVSSRELLRSTGYRLTVADADGNSTTQDLFVPLLGPGTFQPTAGQPAVPDRGYHTATRLLDGRVFIAGGNPSPRSTEIFDPATDSFSSGPNLLDGRVQHSAVLLSNGRVFIAGGRCESRQGACLTTETFDPSAGTVTAGPTVDPIHGAVIMLADGRVLVQQSEGFRLVDPVGGTLGPLIASPVEAQLAVQLSDGRVLIVSTNPVGAVLFTPGPDLFSPAGSPIAFRAYGSAITLLADDRVLLTGGRTLDYLPTETYDPLANAFELTGAQQIGPGFGAYAYQTSTRLQNGAVLVVGGDGFPFAELFDPVWRFFSITGGLRTGRDINSWMVSTHTATLLEDGRVLVVGGCAGIPCEAETYTP